MDEVAELPFLDDRTYLMWGDDDISYPFNLEDYKKALENQKKYWEALGQ
jgi:hypothetical protein